MQISKYANNLNEPRNIHERIYSFVIGVIKLTKQMPKTPENAVIIHQLVKSATSMGANDQEADGAESRKDFIAKYSIVKKETKETIYWLRVIRDTDSSFKISELEMLLNESLELVKIISKIIINTKNK